MSLDSERLEIERRHCMDHAGIDEKTKGLQGQITSRLNLQTWLLAILIGIMVSGMSFIGGAVTSHDKSIARLEDRQIIIVDEVKKLGGKYDNLDKKIDDISEQKTR